MIVYRKLAGSADVSVVIRIVDSTDGTPETGVTSATGGLDLKYRREGATNTDITEGDLATLATAHTDGYMLHIGNGYYRLDLPDAAVAAGAAGVLVHGTVTGMVVIGCYVCLDNAPVDVRAFGGTAGTFASGRPEVNTTHAAGTAWGSGAITAASIAADAIADTKIATGAITSAKFAAGAINATAIASDAITAAKIAADAIGASELAADAVTEIVTAILAGSVETRANTAVTVLGALRVLLAEAAGQRTGNTYKTPDGTVSRITGTVTGGDRTAITLDVSA